MKNPERRRRSVEEGRERRGRQAEETIARRLATFRGGLSDAGTAPEEIERLCAEYTTRIQREVGYA
jgi:hypothetical protein